MSATFGVGRAPLAISLHALIAETTSGVGSGVQVVNIVNATCAQIDVDVTAIAGTASPSLTITIETSRDQNAWTAVGSFVAMSAIGTQRLTFPGLQQYVRARWTITGTTPSFTFAVSGTALVVYCTAIDLAALSIPAAALAGSVITLDQQGRAFIAASDECDDYIDAQVDFPLSSWPQSLASAAAKLSAKLLMTVRGYSPEPGARDIFKDMRDEAIAWLKWVAVNGSPGFVDPTPTVPEGTSYVVSAPPRSWTGTWAK